MSACSVNVGASGPLVQLVDATSPVVPEDAPSHTDDGDGDGDGDGGTADQAEPPPTAQDAGEEAESGPANEDGDADSGGPVTTSVCDLEGRYALRVVFAVTWVGSELLSVVPVIDAGEGELSLTVLMELHANPPELDARFRVCASSIPEFATPLSRERYQTRFDEAVWDSPSMPAFSSTLRTACDAPECAVSSEPLFALLGVRLPASDAPWPADPSEAEWPDDDGDQSPGITAQMLGPLEGYAYPPLDVRSRRRARALMLGLRVVVGLDGVLESCDELRGEAVQGKVETRAVGCVPSTLPFVCGAEELSFVNNNLPVWTVQSGSIEAKRLAEDADCAAARRLFSTDAPNSP